MGEPVIRVTNEQIKGMLVPGVIVGEKAWQPLALDVISARGRIVELEKKLRDERAENERLRTLPPDKALDGLVDEFAINGYPLDGDKFRETLRNHFAPMWADNTRLQGIVEKLRRLVSAVKNRVCLVLPYLPDTREALDAAAQKRRRADPRLRAAEDLRGYVATGLITRTATEAAEAAKGAKPS